MAQKSFKQNNPALSYFTGAGEAEQKSTLSQQQLPPIKEQERPHRAGRMEENLPHSEQQSSRLEVKPLGFVGQEEALDVLASAKGMVSTGIATLKSQKSPVIDQSSSTDEEEEALALALTHSEDYARNTRRTYPPKSPRHYETKSKRLNLLIQPSLAADIGKLATLYRISSNELIVRVLKEYTDKRKAELKKYDRVFLQEE